MQTVTPASAFHDTARLLIDNLHLTVDHDVLVVLIKHTVGLQQLLEGMYAFRLDGIVVQQLVFLVETLLVGEASLCLESREFRGDIGQYEQFVVVHLLGQPGSTLIRQITTVQFLIHHEIEGLHALRHTAVVVLHIDVLRSLHATLDTFL